MIREIRPEFLFIGNAMDARDVRALHEHRIAAVVDLAIEETPAKLAREIIYCRIPLVEGDQDQSANIKMAVGCVLMLLNAKIRTLIACSGGMSRSPAVAAAALAIETATSIDECLTTIAANAPRDVSMVLWSQVKSAYGDMIGK